MAICNSDANSFIQINGAEPPLAGRDDDPLLSVAYDPLDVFCGDKLCSTAAGGPVATLASADANGCTIATTVTGKQFVANK